MCMVGLDFSAALDHVNHKALICKLRQLDVGGSFLIILTKFLSNRLQRVVVDGHKKKRKCGHRQIGVCFHFCTKKLYNILLHLLYKIFFILIRISCNITLP